MRRRQLIATLAALPFALPAMVRAQDADVIREIDKYLNQLVAVRGRFTQINADGSRSTGTYYLWRPGRIRFEYDGGQAMVVADGTNIAVFDAKSSAVQRYPLGTTPLRYLLRREIDLDGTGLAREVSSSGGETRVLLRDPEAPREGEMVLRFSNRPPALKSWTVRDASGQETTVILETIAPVAKMDPRLFNVEAEARAWAG